jgi:hypothetical protein
VIESFLHRLAEVEADQDPRQAILFGRLVKLEYERDAGAVSLQVPPAGAVRLHVLKAMRSVPKTRRNTWAAAPPSTAWAES